MIRYLSRGDHNTITFTDISSFPDSINSKAPPCMYFIVTVTHNLYGNFLFDYFTILILAGKEY